MSRPILCRMGLHALDRETYITVVKRRCVGRKHVWRRNYGICRRCGRLVYQVRKRVEKNE